MTQIQSSLNNKGKSGPKWLVSWGSILYGLLPSTMGQQGSNCCHVWVSPPIIEVKKAVLRHWPASCILPRELVAGCRQKADKEVWGQCLSHFFVMYFMNDPLPMYHDKITPMKNNYSSYSITQTGVFDYGATLSCVSKTDAVTTVPPSAISPRLLSSFHIITALLSLSRFTACRIDLSLDAVSIRSPYHAIYHAVGLRCLSPVLIVSYIHHKYMFSFKLMKNVSLYSIH